MLGVYFSGNDRVYEWSLAFLESFREFNPDLPLRLIPFNEQCDKIFRLAERYHFEIHSDPCFKDLEGIGQKLELGITPTGPFWFRRFSAFWGPWETFFYLDARTIVLADLSPILERLANSRFDLFHLDCALDQVYSPGSFRENLLYTRQAQGFNSGRWASKRSLFHIEELIRLGDECLSLRDQCNPRNTDQFFLNYCCASKDLHIANMADVLGDMCTSGWARQTGEVFRDFDGYRRWDHGGNDHKKRVPLLHWAGIPLSNTMPEAELFFEFRDRFFSGPQRFIRKVSRSLRRPGERLLDAARRQRRINQLWHRLRQK